MNNVVLQTFFCYLSIDQVIRNIIERCSQQLDRYHEREAYIVVEDDLLNQFTNHFPEIMFTINLLMISPERKRKSEDLEIVERNGS